MLAVQGRDAAWLTAAAVFALIDWRGVITGSDRLRWIGKPMTMVALIAAALTGASKAGSPSTVTTWVVIGLVLSLVGDLCLQMPNRDRWFVRGLAAFLVAHVAYVIACAAVGVNARPLGLALIVLALLMAFVGIHVIRGAAHHNARLRKPVTVYVSVISLMGAFAVGTGEWWLIAAAALFYVSDSVLGWNAFIKPAKWMPLTVMITYHLAQAAFVVFLLMGGGR